MFSSTLTNPSIFNDQGQSTSNFNPGTWNSMPTGGSTTTPGTITIGTSTANPWITIDPNYYGNTTISTYGTWLNPLKNLDYNPIFEIDKDNLLSSNLSGIKKNKFLFNCNYVGNRIQPYELIMNLIENKTKFSVKIKISNILTICYTDLQFTRIENNFNFSKECDLSELKVKFKYDKIIFENHKLSKKEARADKLRKLIDQNE